MKNVESFKPRIAVLTSGSGSTVGAFIDASAAGRIDADVGLVVCSQTPEKAGVYNRISELNQIYGTNIDVMEISPRTHPGGKAERGQTDEESQAILDKIIEGNYDHVALMGYMRVVRGALLEEFGWKEGSSPFEARMTNTHPGPLPETTDTFGVNTSQRVLDLGLPMSRHTLHVVAAGVDTGPIVAEHPVPVEPNDTAQVLFDRVQIVEKASLPYAIDKFLQRQREHLHR